MNVQNCLEKKRKKFEFLFSTFSRNFPKNPRFGKIEIIWFLKIVNHKKYIHSSRTRLECDKCEKTFSSNGTLNSHIKNCSYQINEKFKCNSFEKEFTNKGNRNRHQQSEHEGVKIQV